MARENSTASSIDVLLKANTKSLESGTNKGIAIIEGFRKRVSAIPSQAINAFTGIGGSVALGIGGAISAAIAAVATLDAAINQLGEIDSLNKLAAKTKTPIEKLAGLEVAFSQAGIGAENVESALVKVGKGVSEAARGTGDALKIFQKLELDPKKLKGLSGDKQFETIIAALSKVTNATDQAAYAQKIFGDELGSKLPALIAEGSGAIAKYQKEAERLGLVVSQSGADAATNAGDALDRISLALSGSARQFAVLLAPAIETVSDLIVNGIVYARETVTPILQSIFSGLSQAWDYVSAQTAPIVESLKNTFDTISGPIFRLGKTVLSIIGGSIVNKLKFVFDIATRVFGGISAAIESVSPIIGAWYDTLSQIFEAAGGLLLAFESLIYESVIVAFDALTGAIGSAFGFVNDWLGKSHLSWQDFVDGVVTALRFVEYAIKEWRAGLEIAWTAAQLGVETFVNDISYGFTETIPSVFKAFGSGTMSFFTTLGSNIGDAFGQIWEFIRSGGKTDIDFVWKPLSDGFANAFDQIKSIADREKTDVEKRLAGELKTQTENYAANFSRFLQAKEKPISAIAESLDANIAAVAEQSAKDLADASASTKIATDAAERGSSKAIEIIAKNQSSKDTDKLLRQSEKQLKNDDRNTNRLITAMKETFKFEAAGLA